jgi:NitT/TauT family transport system ATP-binding protein
MLRRRADPDCLDDLEAGGALVAMRAPTALVLADQGLIPSAQRASLAETSRPVREECIDPTTLKLTDVGKVFDQLEAIRSISLNVAKGEFVSLLGPSGCGKSTLLMMMGGLIAPTSGNIVIDGSKVSGPRADVGVVFQTPILLPWRSVLDNVLLPIEFLNLPRKDFIDRAHTLLKTVKLEDFAGALPRQLSGGMRQRVSICRALINDPSTLLMDEPFSALDAFTRDEMSVDLLRIWQTYRKTIIFVTHSIREAVFLSDRIVVLGKRPATVIDEVDVALPRPRGLEMMEENDFNQYVRHLRRSIEAGHAI